MVFDQASEWLGFSLPDLCFEPNDRLDLTEYTQAAMATVSIAILKVMEDMGIYADVAAGLSLGEYPALVAAGVMSAEDIQRLLDAGASLVQCYSAVVYEGPGFAGKVCRKLATMTPADAQPQ